MLEKGSRTMGWLIRVDRGVEAGWRQNGGDVRTGVEWFLVAKDDVGEVRFVVRTYPESEAELEELGHDYLARAAREYAFELLERGWDPRKFTLEQAESMAIVVRRPR
jgi:hypothetical protein